MSTPTRSPAAAAGPGPATGGPSVHRWQQGRRGLLGWLVVVLATLVAAAVLSVLVGSNPVPPGTLLQALAGGGDTEARFVEGVRSVDLVEIPQTHFELFTDHRQRTIDLTTDWFTADLLG